MAQSIDYDLSRLSTRSFEQLVQALAAAVISPGITVFGDGPDGGREATFDGSVAFPDPAAPWDGYGVLQAKFRQRPLGGGKDADWALAELGKDLNKFSDPQRRQRSPNYHWEARSMTADIENLILEHLRAIRADLSDVKGRVTQFEIDLASLGQPVGALTTAVYSGRSDTDALRRRIERIEQRLDLADA